MNTNENLRPDSANEFAPENQQPDNADQLRENAAGSSAQTTRRNLDTGEDEPFNPEDLNDKSIMDFGAGSSGGSGGGASA